MEFEKKVEDVIEKKKKKFSFKRVIFSLLFILVILFIIMFINGGFLNSSTGLNYQEVKDVEVVKINK